MTGAMVVLTMLGCFTLLRWYPFVAASGVMGLCWALFAWAPPFMPYTAPVLLTLVAVLVGWGILKERAARG
jgi:hypothetical protein